MKDSTLIKISLILVLVGLSSLAAVSYANKPEQDNAQLYTDQQLIHINGTIINTQNKGLTTRAILHTCAEVPLMMFDPVRLESQRKVSVIAKKEKYKGVTQLVVEELTYS